MHYPLQLPKLAVRRLTVDVREYTSAAQRNHRAGTIATIGVSAVGGRCTTPVAKPSTAAVEHRDVLATNHASSGKRSCPSHALQAKTGQAIKASTSRDSFEIRELPALCNKEIWTTK